MQRKEDSLINVEPINLWCIRSENQITCIVPVMFNYALQRQKPIQI